MTRASRTILSGEGDRTRRGFLRRAGAGGALCLAAPLLSACEILAARDDERYTVILTERQQFEPASMIIPLGATVVWDNQDTIRHAVTTDAVEIGAVGTVRVPDGVRPFSSGNLFPGDTWAIRFTEPGSYVYACPYHLEGGMVGTITVEPEET